MYSLGRCTRQHYRWGRLVTVGEEIPIPEGGDTPLFFKKITVDDYCAEIEKQYGKVAKGVKMELGFDGPRLVTAGGNR